MTFLRTNGPFGLPCMVGLPSTALWSTLVLVACAASAPGDPDEAEPAECSAQPGVSPVYQSWPPPNPGRGGARYDPSMAGCTLTDVTGKGGGTLTMGYDEAGRLQFQFDRRNGYLWRAVWDGNCMTQETIVGSYSTMRTCDENGHTTDWESVRWALDGGEDSVSSGTVENCYDDEGNWLGASGGGLDRKFRFDAGELLEVESWSGYYGETERWEWVDGHPVRYITSAARGELLWTWEGDRVIEAVSDFRVNDPYSGWRSREYWTWGYATDAARPTRAHQEVFESSDHGQIEDHRYAWLCGDALTPD